MPAIPYFGTYGEFRTTDRSGGATLIGADSIVGDAYDVVFEVQDGATVPQARNRFGNVVGYFEAPLANDLLLCRARGLVVRAVLARVIYHPGEEPYYVGEVAVLAYEPRDEAAFERFITNVGALLSKSVRPTVDLGQQGYDEVIRTGGDWLPNTRQPKPALPEGCVVVKENQTFNETLIELARKRNPGCMVAGWGFIVLLAVLVLWGLKGVFNL